MSSSVGVKVCFKLTLFQRSACEKAVVRLCVIYVTYTVSSPDYLVFIVLNKPFIIIIVYVIEYLNTYL